MRTIRSALLLATLLLVTACKKTEETKPAEGNTIASDADYETRATELTNKLLAIFVADGTDCDKLAADLTKFGDDHRAVFQSLQAYEKAHPEAEKSFDEKMKPREKEMEEKLGPSFDACKDHEGMKKAMQNLPLD